MKAKTPLPISEEDMAAYVEEAKKAPGRTPKPKCRVCGKESHARGLCSRHYMRLYRKVRGEIG